MICIVRCHKKIMIRLPDGEVKRVGERAECPSSCIYRCSAGCSKDAEFEVKSSNCFDSEVAIPRYNPAPLSYSQAGSSLSASVTASKAVETPAPRASALAAHTPSRETHTAAPVAESAPPSSMPTHSESPSSSGGRKSYVSFGGSNRTSTASEPTTSRFLTSERSYDYFEIGMDCFSNDISIRRACNARPLTRALSEIFFFWEIDLVFKSRTELHDRFIWLMTSVLDFDIPRADVQVILENPNYDMSQKFFYIFYDIVFKREPPRGFYWSSSKSTSQNLVAHFTDRYDFIVKYCREGEQGERFRRFFRERKREILHYLGVVDETAFFDEITFELAEENNEIVWIDRYNDYRPIRLGTIDDFIDAMQVPTSISKMRAMIAFLEKYRVTSEGIVLRSSQHAFQRSERGGLREDQSMYSVLQLASSSSYATEYDYYVTLLREYVKVFAPRQVTVGSLIFTRANFSEEIANVVFELCASYFGKVDDEYLQRAKANAWITKSLYERGILCTFVCENDSYIRKLMELIVEPDLEQYLELFKHPLFRASASRTYTISEHIAEALEADVFTANATFEQDSLIREYFEIKIQDISKLNMNDIYKEYQKQYDAFIKP